MTKIAFLACAETLSHSTSRRADAFEHDAQLEALTGPFAERGLHLAEVDWQASLSDFEGCAAALIATPWDYQERQASFIAKLEALEEKGVVCFNPPSLVRWNIDKIYLKDLAGTGIPTIPTIWSARPGPHTLTRAFETFETERLVVKRRIGAGAEGQEILSRSQPDLDRWRYVVPVMIQPFMEEITRSGELSMIFVDGRFSHAVLKRPAEGDYRIQSVYGGTEHSASPSEKAMNVARAVIEAMPGETPLYARIDLLASDHDPMLMEAEVIEPYLYPHHGPQLGALMAQAMAARLQA